jgi:molybdopterin converting factor small subunit
MRIKLELGGPLREEKGQWHLLTLRNGSTVRDALRRAGVTEELYIMVFKNSKRAELSDSLSEGDVLVAFPPVGGGSFGD